MTVRATLALWERWYRAIEAQYGGVPSRGRLRYWKRKIRRDIADGGVTVEELAWWARRAGGAA